MGTLARISDDVIRSKILQTMHAKKLHREALVKRYTLQQLLEHTANKKDIDRQAQDMDQKFAPDQDRVKRIHPPKNLKPKDKRKPKQPHDDKNESACQFCYKDHKGPRSNRPASGKNMACVQIRVISLACSNAKTTRKVLHRN